MKKRRYSPALAISLLLLLDTHGASAQASRSAGSTSCRQFVQSFYDQYVPIALKDLPVPAYTIAIQRWPNRFSPQLRDALKKDWQAQSKSDELVGLDFDPFLNSQDPSPRFVVDAAQRQGNRCQATVYGMNWSRRQEKVLPELAIENGHWTFVNFRYEDSGTPNYDLLGLLRGLAKDRDSHPANP